MLTDEERRLIHESAYVPEHLPDYVQAISAAEPFIIEGYLCYRLGRHLIFVGYPLGEPGLEAPQAYERVLAFFRPATVSVIAPRLWEQVSRGQERTEDSYYQLGLPLAPLGAELSYMLRRAGREVKISYGEFRREHAGLIDDFLTGRQISHGHQEIFRKVSSYLQRAPTSRLLEARRNEQLVAFNVMDLGSARYLFYLFNFRSLTEYVPGTSDLLFSEMVNLAQEVGKKAVNLGLGISPGVRRFKEKWGASAFLTYTSVQIRREPAGIFNLLRRFF